MSSVSISALLRIARGGLYTQQFSMDSLSSNIANVNTTGYKRVRAEFQELLTQAQQDPSGNSNRVLGQAAGATVSANQRIFSQGAIQKSGNLWDLAVAGEGFFQIQQNDGTLAFTRDGSFKLDGEGRLVTVNGNFVMPELVIPPDAENIFISSGGVVMARRQGETEPEEVGTITLAQFRNPSGLESVGNNLYLASGASGEAQISEAQVNGAGQIISGAIESSNVDLSQEMVDLISAQRAYSLMARALKISDDMLSMVNQMRG